MNAVNYKNVLKLNIPSRREKSTTTELNPNLEKVLSENAGYILKA